MNASHRIDLPHQLDLPKRLARRLTHPLPGPAAQSRYQPYGGFGRHFGPAPSSARPAAVLALLYLDRGAWHIPLTLRPLDLPDHAGQVSLPGGMIEPGELSDLAAIRELEEELGAAGEEIELLGELSPIYLFRSNFTISPWLAATGQRPEWHPNPAEVAELVELPLAALLDPATTHSEVWQDQGISFEAPAFHWQGHAIWGATAMILAELAAILLALDD